MENKKIALATINDIENDKNVDNLSLITKVDLKLTNSKNEKCNKIRNINFEDSLRMNDEQIKVKEAVFILHNMENFNYSISYTEIQNIRNDLRLFAINNYHDKKYADCLIQAIHSYMIAKKYYSKYFGFYITGDMSTELILICKCYVLVQKYTEGRKYLNELKFLIDNTLLYAHNKGIFTEQQKDGQNKDINKINDLDSNYQEPIILCGIEVLSNILYIFADLLSSYKQNEEAESYFLKYLYIIDKSFNADSLNYSDALNDVCSYYIKIRDYSKALPLCEQILEIRKKFFGDYDSENPSEIIADCYCNLGLLLRLSGNTIESLHKYLIAVDMRMKIHKTRHTIEVQDILFSFAIIMHQLNNFKVSLQLYKEVYSFYKIYYGPDDTNTIIVCKLIEELEKDIMKEMDKSKKKYPSNLESHIPNVNDKLTKESKIKKNWNLFNEKLQTISKKSDIDPNLIENLMNERVLINTKNIPYKNLSDKKTFITVEGNLKYNDLSYCSIDAYKHMQSNKEFEILKSSFYSISSINRIKSLYADSWKSTLIPSTYILPFVEAKLVDKKLIKFSECKDFQNAIIFKRKILPIVNIPLIERGYVQLDNDQPIMTCNEDAKSLLSEWNIKEPFVDSQGNVFSKYEHLDNEFNMFISILDDKNEVMLGFYNNPLLVPNPAIYHCLILNDLYYFHRYNHVNNLYSFDNINPYRNKNISTKINRGNNLYKNSSNAGIDHSYDYNTYKKEEKSSKISRDSKIINDSLKNTLEKNEQKGNIKNDLITKRESSDSNKTHINDESKYIPKDIPLSTQKSETVTKKGVPKELSKGVSKELSKLFSKKMSKQLSKQLSTQSSEQMLKKHKSEEKKVGDMKFKGLGFNKKLQNKKLQHKKVHVLKGNRESSSTLFSRDKYVLKKSINFNNLFLRSNEKIKLIGYSNSNKTDKIQRSMRKIKLKKDPILKSSIDYNIKFDLQNNVSSLEHCDIDNLKREIYYDNSPCNSHTNSTNLSFDDEEEMVASYKEHKKKNNNRYNKPYKHIKDNTYNNVKNNLTNENKKKKNENVITHYNEENNESSERSSEYSTDNSDENVSDMGSKNYNSFYSDDRENNNEDIIDIHKIFDTNIPSNDSRNTLNLNPLINKKDSLGNDTSNYTMKCANNEEYQRINESENSLSSNNNTLNSNFASFNSDTINENSMYENKSNTKSINLNTCRNKSVNSCTSLNKFHIKDKLNHIKNVNKNDISFKFRFNKGNSFRDGNILLDTDISESEIYGKSFLKKAKSSSKPHLVNGICSNDIKLNDTKLGEHIFDKTMEDSESFVFSTHQMENGRIINGSENSENILFSHSTGVNVFLDNRYKSTLKNKERTVIKEYSEEIELSENEEFYKEVILDEAKIDSNIMDIYEVENSRYDNAYNNRNRFLKENQNECSDTNDRSHSSALYKNEKVQKIHEQRSNYKKLSEDNTYGMYDEETSSGIIINNEVNGIHKDSFTDNLFLRSNSIEELDSNLITNKYKSKYSKKEIKRNYSGKINNNKKVTDTLDDELNDISVINLHNEQENQNLPNNMTILEEEADIMSNINYDDSLNENDKINMMYASDNKNYISNKISNNNNKKNGIKYSSNLTYNSMHNVHIVHNVNGNKQGCDINKDDSFYYDVTMNSDNNSNNVNKKKKKKKKLSSFLQLNKRKHVLKLFSIFSKKKLKKKEQNSNTMNNEYIINDLEPFSTEGKNVHLLSNALNDKLAGKNNAKELIEVNSIMLKGKEKKKKFISEPLHGMDKPRLNIKSKVLGLKKLMGTKKGFLSKINVIEKKVLENNKDTIKSNEKNNSPLMKQIPKQDINKDESSNLSNIKEESIEKQSSKDSIHMDNSNEEKNEESYKNENTLVKKINTVNYPKKIMLKKIVPKVIPKMVVNKINNIKDNNTIKKSNDLNNNNHEVKIVKNINDKLAFDILRKVKYCKIGFQPDENLGTLPTVHLLNEDKVVLAIVPWQLDLTSFSLAKSSMEEETIKKIGLMHREFEISIEDRKKQVQSEMRLLTGEGLKELGFTSSPTISKDTLHDVNLLSGIDINALKNSYKIEKKSEQIEKAKEKEKSSQAKKEPPKIAPKTKGGKKGAPKFMKGPPKGVKGGPVVGKGKFSKIKQAKDEGKTKRFFWEALFEDDIPGTLFEDKKELMQKIVIEKENVEKCFSKAVSKKEEGNELKIRKPKVIQLLPDSKREYNMSIALSKFSNYTFKEIRDAIMDLNPHILNLDNTEVLMQYVPTPEEFEIVKEYICSKGDLNLVDKPEQYVAALLGVPLLKQRLESHYFALSFKENYENTLNPLENILESCEAIKGSTKLFTILFTILNVGNTLNYGDPQRGNAFGFKLTTLSKLNDIRSSTKPVKTLLQYICETIYEKSVDTLDIMEELRCIEKVVKTDKQIIDTVLQKLKLGSNKIKNVLELAKKNPEDPLYEALKEFYFSVEPKIQELETFYDQTFAIFKEISLYLGYKEKEVSTIQVQDFFKELWKFIQSVEFNRKTIQENVLKELKKKERMLENEKKGAALSKRQNFTIAKKKEKTDPKAKLTKKTFKIF
ncbi:formin 1, putative [Plasmodium malariae]|uniref:Formin 1, putative n=1 Tax=Plasmodium malariae TaxID=5858 RepID=A0A1A8VZK0_PLAMA|nr:formin 1, putative [Plasmodium malariae]